MTLTCYRIRVTKSRVEPEWLCRLVPLGASPYDSSAVLVGRYPTQPEAVAAGCDILPWSMSAWTLALALTAPNKRKVEYPPLVHPHRHA